MIFWGFENKFNFRTYFLICANVLLMALFSTFATGESQPFNITERHLDKSRQNFVLLGTSATGEILIWAGLDQDDIPWIDIIKPANVSAEKLSFIDKKTRKIVVPMTGTINKNGRLFAFTTESMNLGVYDLMSLQGFLFKSKQQSTGVREFLVSPKWFSDDEIASLKITNLRSVQLSSITTGISKIFFSSSKLFISDYDVGPKGLMVYSLGPATKNLFGVQYDQNSYGIFDIRAERINLYIQRNGDKDVAQITNGVWLDFAPKISPGGTYIAFLRGQATAEMRYPRSGEEYTLSDTKPALHIYDFQTKKEWGISKSDFIKTSFDFSWRDERTLSFVKRVNKGSAIYLYDVKSKKYMEFYRAKGVIQSFSWWSNGNNLVLIERRDDSNDFLITISPK